MKPPALDRSIGMEVYSTQIPGISGRIKQTPDQFVVEEILDKSSLDLVERADEEHAYPLYLLQKEGIDSSHAVREVELATGLRLKVVGLKDAKAITRQYVSVTRKQQNAKSKLVTKHCMLDLVGYTRKPIAKGKLVANMFAITINDFEDDGVEKRISELQGCIDNNTIANFYGYQRFGSSRPVTHLVGKEMIKRNFRQAVELKNELKGKKCYIFAFDTLDFWQLENFPFVECWVNTACNRILDDYEKFQKPLVDLADIRKKELLTLAVK